MAKYGKAALFLATVQALTMAQVPQVRPGPQPHPAPAASSAPAPVPTARPAARPAIALDSKRFVTNENFFHTSPKPQPDSSAPATAQPGTDTAVRAAADKPSSVPIMSRPVVPQPVKPAAIASLPEIPRPQPAQISAVVITSSSASTPASHNASAAVDYASGKLTVVADSAPLGFVLKLIAARTGAVVDLAPELQNEPVIARLGPDSVREVLTGLLDSPRIDYIVFGTGDEPGSLHRIVVRTRHSFGQVALAAIRPLPKQAEPAEEEKLDQNGHLISNGAAAAEATLEQSMENWRKVREQMRQAEIKQQAEDREKEKTQSPDPPAPARNNPEPESPSESQQGDPPQQ